VNRTTRLAIVAGIIIAFAGGATYAAVSAPEQPQPSADNGGNNNTNSSQLRQINESLSVDAK
jgi:hypothetical protein